MERSAAELKLLLKVAHDFWWLPFQFVWWGWLVPSIGIWEDKNDAYEKDIEDLIN